MKKPKKLLLKEYYDIYGISLCLDQGYNDELLQVILPIAKHYQQIFKYDVYAEVAHMIDERGAICWNEFRDDVLNQYHIINKKDFKKLSYSQLINIFKIPMWNASYGGKAWAYIVRELIKLEQDLRKPNLKKLMYRLDRLNNLAHNNSLVLVGWTYFDFRNYAYDKDYIEPKQLISKCSDTVKKIYGQIQMKNLSLVMQYH